MLIFQGVSSPEKAFFWVDDVFHKLPRVGETGSFSGGYPPGEPSTSWCLFGLAHVTWLEDIMAAYIPLGELTCFGAVTDTTKKGLNMEYKWWFRYSPIPTIYQKKWLKTPMHGGYVVNILQGLKSAALKLFGTPSNEGFFGAGWFQGAQILHPMSLIYPPRN